MSEETDKLFRELSKLKRCKQNCIGISATGNPSLFLNQQGNWVNAGGSSSIIEVTKSEFLALVSGEDLQFPATYKLTDVENGLFISTISDTSFNAEATLLIYLPSYTVSGSYKGQYHTEIGSVANGEIYTWGEWNYKNESGGALTPDTPSPNTFDSGNRFTKLTKNSSNFYELSSLLVQISIISGTLYLNQYNNTKTSSTVNNLVGNLFGIGNSPVAQLNLNTFLPGSGFNNGVMLLNNRVDFSNNNRGILNNSSNYFSVPGSGNVIQNCYIKGTSIGETGIQSNNLFGSGVISNIYGNVRIAETNIVGGTSSVTNFDIPSGLINMVHCHVQDNSHISDFTTSGTGEVEVWDCEMHENVNIRRWTFSHNTGLVSFIDSYLNANVELLDFTYTAPAVINFTDGQNFTIQNATNITFNNVSFLFPLRRPPVVFDLTGWSRNITNESIVGSKGFFTFTHDFSANPLASGSSVYYNFIPENSVGTKLTTVVDGLSGGVGATLALGIETDDTTYGFGATVLGSLNNSVVNTVSNITTANRSLQLTAGVNNVTSGTITVTFEFTFNNG